MIDRKKVLNFINIGTVITKKNVYSFMLTNLFFSLINIIFLLINESILQLIIYLSLFSIYLLSFCFLCNKKSWSLKHSLLCQGINYFIFLIVWLTLVYLGLANLGLISQEVFLIIIISLIPLYILMYYLILKKLVSRNNKIYYILPAATSGMGGAIFLLLKSLNIDYSDEGKLIVSFLVTILFSIICLYYSCSLWIKWYYVKKFNITKYDIETINYNV